MKFALMFASLGAIGLMSPADGDSPPPGGDTASPPVDPKQAAKDAAAAAKAAADADKAAKKAAAKKVKCRCLINSLGEDDNVYVKDQVFETTAERAAALGDSVEIQS